MAKKILSGKESMETLLKGLNLAADTVSCTIGPKGKNVYSYEPPFNTRITNDGATIASKVILEDPLEDAGAYTVRNVASQQNDDAGDGTTTVIVFFQSLIQECLKRPENVMEIEESLKAAGNKVLKILSKKSVKIRKEDLEKVALISAENPQLAKIIAEIIKKLGEKAVISVEDSKTFATEYEIVSGYEASNGFMSPGFSDKTGKATFEDVPVLVCQKKIATFLDLNPIVEKVKADGSNQLAIFCEDIDDSILGALVAYKRLGAFNSVVIRATGDGLEDIEGATGATIISDRTGVNFQNIGLEHLGKAKKLVADSSKTLIIGTGMKAKVRAAEIEKKAEIESNRYLAELMKIRAAKLRGGVGILKVGASTDFEREYLKLKAEDAVKATQAALEEGVVEGGGMAFWRIAKDLKPKTIGEEIIKKCLTAPLRKIIENAGKDYTEIIVNMPEGQGYNAKDNKYVDMIKSGIVDPAKVERCALENAVSAAGKFITTACVVGDIPEKNA